MATDYNLPPASGLIRFAEFEWRVVIAGELCAPCWAQRGAALAYLNAIARGERKAEVEELA